MEGKKGDGFTLNLIIINISYIKHLTVQLKILNDFFLQLRWGGGDWLTPPSSTGIGLIEKLLLDLNWKDHLIKHFWVLFYCRFRKKFCLSFRRSKNLWIVLAHLWVCRGGFVRIQENSNLIFKKNPDESEKKN